jgi:hypothetical protein
MSGELAVQGILIADAPFMAVCTDVHYDEIMQTYAVPLALVTLMNIEPSDFKDAPSDFDFERVTVYSMAATKIESNSLARLARQALERKSGTFNGVAVDSIKFVDQSTFTEQLTNKKVYTTEQIYQVITTS